MRRRRIPLRTRGKHPCGGVSFFLPPKWIWSAARRSVNRRTFFGVSEPGASVLPVVLFPFRYRDPTEFNVNDQRNIQKQAQLHFYVSCLNICCPLWGPCRNCLLLDICVTEIVRVSLSSAVTIFTFGMAFSFCLSSFLSEVVLMRRQITRNYIRAETSVFVGAL